MILKIIVKPRSNISKVISFDNNFLTVKVSAPPYKGESNRELIKTLSTFFDVPKSSINIIRGTKSRIKEVFFTEKQKIILGIKKLL